MSEYLKGIIIQCPEEDDESEEFFIEINSFTETLDENGIKYSCGQDDGVFFIGSNDPAAIKQIQIHYPEYEIKLLKVDDFDWDRLVL